MTELKTIKTNYKKIIKLIEKIFKDEGFIFKFIKVTCTKYIKNEKICEEWSLSIQKELDSLNGTGSELYYYNFESTEEDLQNCILDFLNKKININCKYLFQDKCLCEKRKNKEDGLSLYYKPYCILLETNGEKLVCPHKEIKGAL